MGRARTPWLAALALLLVAAGALVPGARADEPDRSAWLVGRTYGTATVARIGDAVLEVYAASDLDDAKELEEAALRVLVVRGQDVVESYHADRTRLEGERRRLDVRWEDQGAEDPGILVSISLLEAPQTDAEAAQRAVTAALAAAGPWGDASTLLATALAEADPALRRPLALAAYRALESASAAHPTHLGILHDLLVADQALAPLVAGSDRGANLAFLWRAHVSAAMRSGDLDLGREARRTSALAALAESCYGVAATVLGNAAEGDDADLDALKPALERLGQHEQEFAGSTPVVGRGGTVALEVSRCAAEPPADAPLFHRLTFTLRTPNEPAVPSAAWYSLSREPSSDHARWALYGWVGGSRRLLHLYGAVEPEAEPVAGEVLALVRAAVGAEEGK